MHILITGAAGMIGRKLTQRLATERALGGEPLDKLTLVDIVAPGRPAGFSDRIEIIASCTSEAQRVISSKRASDPDSIARMIGLGISASGLGPRAMSIA